MKISLYSYASAFSFYEKGFDIQSSCFPYKKWVKGLDIGCDKFIASIDDDKVEDILLELILNN